VKAWVVEGFVFRQKAFLTWQTVVEFGPGILVLGEHMVFNFDCLRIIQRSRRDAFMVIGAMKSD